MCGIAGILNLADREPVTRDTLTAMIGTLRHRGPDGFGYFVSGPVGLAHARLSIIDLQTGQQPLANEDDSVWVTFNGEIFNYPELREELTLRGHRFRTQSDTETIVHAYEEYGDEFVHRLNGQFAFALWDAKRQRLVLARDRVGIRPLFYAQDAGRLLFASEIRALRPALSRSLELDVVGLGQTFTLWSTLEERTSFLGIQALPPGHMLCVERDRQSLRRYWDWDFPEAGAHSNAGFDDAAEELRSRLSDAVRLQLRADVPVGAYLSGGLDSAAIAALVRLHSTAPLQTFSLVFDDAEFDESGAQEVMARHLGTKHTAVRCSAHDIGALFPEFVRHAETPVLRTAPVPLMMLSRLVRDAGYKVVLTGEGADEVFGGYDIFKEAKVRRFWAREPESAGRSALLTRLYPYLAHSPVRSAPLAAAFYRRGFADTANPCYAHLPRWNTTQRLWNFFSAEARAKLDPQEPRRAVEKLLPPASVAWNGMERDQYVEAHTLMSGYLLSSQGDRVAMANSIEGRVPFLDHRLIEFANRLPPRFKLRGLREKALLRHAVRDLLPSDIARRGKQPYRAPDSASFFRDGKPLDYVAETLSPERIAAAGYFDASAVTRLFEKCRAGRVIGFSDNMAFVGILSTMLLHEIYVR